MMTHHKIVSIAFLSLLFTIIIICSIFQHSTGFKIYSDSQLHSTHHHINEQDWREFEDFREWKRSRNKFMKHHNTEKSWNDNDRLLDVSNHVEHENSRLNWNYTDPPPSDYPALVGRYVVNQASWASVATISSHDEISSFPFVNVVAVSDGPLGNGTGVPYIYLTPLDFTAKDIKVDSRVTFMMTLAQGHYCQQKMMDPIDPRCARIILSGKIKKILKDTDEHEIAKTAVFNRHPTLINMPTDHEFFFAKLKIAFIAVLDTYGGAKFISNDEYFHPPGIPQKIMFDMEQNELRLSKKLVR
ncbi:hypothetical protein PV327_000837 [Microctonus hyperodae]|uniref:CREG-like beta-barrel domain-containing protein n=1 Tax=Microctonus hyperodae TaxID=165561 RepID=A0AA39G7Z0_MICHY|nr:hypothetical protein PV327_000837 [Microctonus hyperodae]